MPIDLKRNVSVSLSGYKALFTSTPETLSAPGLGTVVDLTEYRSFTVQYDVSNIDTNVVIRLLGSNDNLTFYNLSEIGDTTITTNGAYSFISPPFIVVPYINFQFVSESGGTNATVTWQVAAG